MKAIINFIANTTGLSIQESWWLLEHITKKNRATLMIHDYQLTKIEQNTLNRHIEEITHQHKPLAYILGSIPFLDIQLTITPPILIPRPETENWVGQLITTIRQSKVKKDITILDIGTGSGCIALSLGKAFPQATIYAVDINLAAINLAEKNAANNSINNVTFIKSDLFLHIPKELKFDLIISNPPYISPLVKLDPSVAAWEDHYALFADRQGIFIIEQIIQQAKSHLTENKELPYQLVIEIDATQGKIAQNLCKSADFKVAAIQKDQFDRDRTVWVK